MITPIIREATIKDAPGIATVHVKMWQKAYRSLVPDFFLDQMSIKNKIDKWLEILRNPKEGVKVFVAEADNTIVGWVSGGKNRDEDLTPDIGELFGIYIHPDWQGRGIGSALLENFLGFLRGEGYSKATLWVLDTNEKTRSWYESKGWKLEGNKKTEAKAGFDLHEIRYIIDLKE